jgi:hypothetical protein
VASAVPAARRYDPNDGRLVGVLASLGDPFLLMAWKLRQTVHWMQIFR